MIEIRSVADFDACLDKTVVEIDSLVDAEPDYPVWGALQKQLRALRLWSEDDAKPSPQQLSSIGIGLIAARELEPASEEWMQDLIDRLHLLNYFWRYWPEGPPIRPRGLPTGIKKATIIAIVIAAAVLTLVMLLNLIARTGPSPWTRQGPLMLAGGVSATLETSLESYRVGLNRNPENDRYSVRLRIADRTVPLAENMRGSDLRFDARLLGDDGHQLWFFVQGVGAWDYGKHRLITKSDLRRANPALGSFPAHNNITDPLVSKVAQNARIASVDLWSGEARLYDFDKQLTVVTPDFSETFRIEPESLRAIAGNRGN